ncbi:MAG: hypothetical protein NXY57DRAFT_418430 [Lentinula lateritia]|nr:MAG: hypothetical protein NXY57DRAFT_418430 [Lentinula lateritia]
MEKTLGRAHEWMDVQELLTGGTTFSILNIIGVFQSEATYSALTRIISITYIDNTENSVSVQPFQPHGFRISGRPSTSSHFQDVVVADQRVISFLEYFIKEDENAVVMNSLVPIFPSTEFLKHSVPIPSEKYMKLYIKQIQSPFRRQVPLVCLWHPLFTVQIPVFIRPHCICHQTQHIIQFIQVIWVLHSICRRSGLLP